ncbi:MAG: tRNA (adenosine(37)-N6)-threonylcarbamoyltransferase complex dimerization subunit type 1 TsaB [Tissierellaceae bacterium]|nr:tRNA (adenosine(37)-N6)-threonylcarbamoyltransferase complex dimerization subunit type 1 TsaB [Tissierellaceae bacterium]
MKILAIDTSTVVATCAILDEEKVLGEFSLNQQVTHSENLVPMIKEMMDGLNLNIKDIDFFAGAVGPGSFTGIRIGIATIKGFAHVTKKKVIGVSTLEGLAFNVPYAKIVIPMIDGRRNRVYTGIYGWEKGKLLNMGNEKITDIDDFLRDLDIGFEKIVFNGDGALKYKEKIMNILKERAIFSPINLNMPRASGIGELAMVKINEGKAVDCYSLVPKYLREAQAQMDLIKRGY